MRPMTTPLARRAASLLATLVALFPLALAQSDAPAAPPAPAAERLADAAVRDWLAGKFKPEAPKPAPGPSDAESLEAVLRQATRQLSFSPVPKDARANLALRELVGVREDKRFYRYPLSVAGEDASVTVTVQGAGDAWQVTAVRLGAAGTVSLIPPGVGTPVGGWVFVALTALLAWATLANTRWRTWVLEGFAQARRYWGVHAVTNALLYGTFALFSLAAFAAPGLVAELQEYLSTALASSGIGEALKGGVASAAFGITLNNLRAGILLTSFLPGSLFALPAYVINFFAFSFYGLTLSPAAVPLAQWLFHLPTILIELQAYIFITSSAGVMVYRILRERVGFGQAWLEYARVLPVALLFLVVGAWYEAFEILVLIPTFAR